MQLTDEQKLLRAEEAAKIQLDIQKRKKALKESSKLERESIKALEGEVARLLDSVRTGEEDGQEELPFSPETQSAVGRLQKSMDEFAKQGVTVRTKVGDGDWNTLPVSR
jgi:hypothetical protein